MNKFEQWKDVKLKHAEYANLGRILNEAIECFGDVILIIIIIIIINVTFIMLY